MALAYADLTLLSVNSTVAIVANVIISTTFLGEKFTPRYDLPGMLLIAIGCTMIFLVSNKEKPVGSIELIREEITNYQSVVYFIIAAIVIGYGKMIIDQPFKNNLRKFESDCEEFDSGQ